MTQQPSPKEMLEAAHEFPGRFMFKVIGKSDDGFAGRIVAIVREELRMEADPPFALNETGSGKYLSVTLTPEVESAEQVLAVYSRLSQTDGVVMTL